MLDRHGSYDVPSYLDGNRDTDQFHFQSGDEDEVENTMMMDQLQKIVQDNKKSNERVTDEQAK